MCVSVCWRGRGRFCLCLSIQAADGPHLLALNFCIHVLFYFVVLCSVLFSPVMSCPIIFCSTLFPYFITFWIQRSKSNQIKAKQSITKHLSLLWTYDHKISRDMRFNDRRQRCILYFLWVSVYRENHLVHSDVYSMPLLFANQFYQIPSADIFDRAGTSHTGIDLPAFHKILLLLSAVRTTFREK